MSAEALDLLRTFARAFRQRDPAVIEYQQLEAERRRIQRENGFDERGEPLRR